MTRRQTAIVLLVVAGALAYGIWRWNVTHFHLGSWLQVHTGTVNEPGPYYGFFSGFGSDLSEIAIVAGLVTVYRKHNCHVDRCFRIGRYPVAGTPYTTCRRHHPHVDANPTAEDIAAAHIEDCEKH